MTNVRGALAIYVPDKEWEFVAARAAEENVSVSRWLRGLVEMAHSEWAIEQNRLKAERHERKRKR